MLSPSDATLIQNLKFNLEISGQKKTQEQYFNWSLLLKKSRYTLDYRIVVGLRLLINPILSQGCAQIFFYVPKVMIIQ